MTPDKATGKEVTPGLDDEDSWLPPEDEAQVQGNPGIFREDSLVPEDPWVSPAKTSPDLRGC